MKEVQINQLKTVLNACFNQLTIAEKKAINKMLQFLQHLSSYNTEEIQGTTAEKIQELENFTTNSSTRNKTFKESLSSYLKMMNFLDQQFQKNNNFLTIAILKQAWEKYGFNFPKTKDNLIFRRHEVHITGFPKTSLVGFRFIDNHLINFLDYFNNSIQTTSLLTKSFLLHHYFEIIHPFPDGNGRLGRILLIYFWKMHDLWPKDIACPFDHVFYPTSFKRKYLQALNSFQNSSELQKIYQSFCQKKIFDVNYLVFLQRQKVNFDFYQKEMLFFYESVYKLTQTFIEKYNNQKKKFSILLSDFAQKKQFRILLSQPNLLQKLPELCFSGKLFIYISDLTLKLKVDGRTLEKILRTTNLFSKFKIAKKPYGNKHICYANEILYAFFAKTYRYP